MLGLGADLLPVVPDANATPAPNSVVAEFGKVPSTYDGEGNARGLAGWQTREITPSDIARWSADRRYSVCVRASRVRAIDVDLPGAADAARVRTAISMALDLMPLKITDWPARTRSNSSKFLLPFHLDGEWRKRRIVLPGDRGAIEFLANGQQWVAAGSHPSGVLYEWRGGLPTEFPTLTAEQFEAIWSAVYQEFKADGAVLVGQRDGDDGEWAGAADNEVLRSIDEPTLKQLKEALAYPPLVQAAAAGLVWTEVGYALLSIPQGRELFTDFSRAAPNYQAGDESTWWQRHLGAMPRTDYRHIFAMARRLGWGAAADPSLFPVVAEETTETGTTAERVSDGADVGSPGDASLVPPMPEKPILRLVAGQLHNNARQAEEILAPELFVQSGRLVRLVRASDYDQDAIQRDANQRCMTSVTTSFIRRKLTELAFIQKYDARMEDWKNIDCPADLAYDIIGHGDWPVLRPLDAIAQAPFLRADGTVCEEAGYDARSRVLYIPNSVFRTVGNPSHDDAVHALATLIEPFEQFPFGNEASRSAFIAHILTEAGRVAMETAPMFWYTAPNAGTGKSLLADMAPLIVHGVMPARRPWIGDSEEIRKTLFASLIAGDRSITFDNVPNGVKVRSPELCGFLTSPVYRDRKLGASEVSGAVNRTVVVGSGNNVTPASDMARRSIVVRLDAEMTPDQLKGRRFKIPNLMRYVRERRVELLHAALTILAAAKQYAKDIDVAPLASFESWSTLVRNALLWLEMPDPLGTQEDETDDDSSALVEAFQRLAEINGIGNGERFRAQQIVEGALSMGDISGSMITVLQATGCADPTNVLKVGYWLREQKDKVVSGYKLTRDSNIRGIQYWRLVHVARRSIEDMI